jgi:RimJ/RimL family protein N-acetyltransferase
MRTSIRLEPFSEADFDRLIAWSPTAEFLLQWAGPLFTFPLDRAQLEQYLASSRQTPSGMMAFRAVDDAGGKVIGHIELAGIDHRQRSARLSRVLVGPAERRGKGIGRRVVQAALRIAFGDLRLHRVDLFVFDFNRPAIACYERAGFRHEGTLREARKQGEAYWNVCVMSILEHEWRACSEQQGES